MKPEIKERIEKIRKGEVPEGYRKTKVGIIPDDWDLVKLSKLLKVKHGKSQKEVECYGGLYPILASGGIIGYTNDYLYNKPSVLIGRKGTIDKPQYREEPFWSVDTLFYSEINEQHNPKYIYYKFCQINWRKYNEASGVPSLSSSTIGSIKIVTTKNCAEQEKIVEIISTWDKAIELKEKLIEEKKEFKRGLMQKLLTGKVRFPEFTDDWTEYQLKDICKFMKGSGLSKEKLSIYGEKKCILYGELYTTYSEVIQEVKSKTNIVEGVPSQKGDVLIPASTTTSGIDLANATALEENSVLLGGDINILRNDKSLFNSSFLAHYLTHIKKLDIASKAQGITIVHLYGKHLTKIQIEMPQAKEQEKIAQVLSIQDDVIEILTEKLLQLKQQKKGLMQLLLTGIVRVEVN